MAVTPTPTPTSNPKPIPNPNPKNSNTQTDRTLPLSASLTPTLSPTLTPTLTPSSSALTVAGWRVVEVAELNEFWFGKSEECSKYDGDQAERWGHMATKLRLWQMTQYERIMYLDADTVLTGPVDATFKSVRGFAAEKALHHTHFNAGVMLLTPSEQTFAELLALGAAPHTRLFGNVIDCTEQVHPNPGA